MINRWLCLDNESDFHVIKFTFIVFKNIQRNLSKLFLKFCLGICSDCVLGGGGAKKTRGGQKSKRQVEQVAAQACPKVSRLHQPAQKCGQNHRPCKIYRHSRISRPGWTLLGFTQGGRGGEKYGALREGKNRGYCSVDRQTCV